MIKTNQKITIDDEDIFANDLLGREQSITDLSKLVENQKEPLVLSINADWGAGKTTFVQLWKAHLKKQEIKSIYFNAWEDDFSDEPLVAILGELNAYISGSSNELKNNFEKTKKIASKVIPTLMKLGANIATAGIAGEATEKTTKALIDNYQANKNDLQKLKESIAEVLKAINPNKPFVIFIDELDRCKPLYAIELLERIKHIFDIERLIFVLSMDKNNLAKSIQSQYGNIDTDNYLRRFIHLEYPLKNPSVDKFCEVSFQQFNFANILRSKNANNNYCSYDTDLIQKLSISFGLSLRQIEQIFIKLHIFLKTMPLNFYQPQPFLVFILFECLKSHDKQLYDDFLAGKSTAQKTIQGIVLNVDSAYQNEYINIKTIILATPLRNDPEAYKKLIEMHPNLVDSLQPEIHSRHVGMLQRNIYSLTDAINTTIKRIDLAEKFDFSTDK